MPGLSIQRLSAVAIAVLASASMWFYVDRILVPYQIGDAVEHNRPRGNLSDLYPRWLGSRELLLRGRNPYSIEVTREIQAGYYGRVLDASRAGDPDDQQAFAYPVYVSFLLAPTVYLPFHTVQQGFHVFLWALTGVSVVLWLCALRWRPAILTIAIFIILTLGSVPAVQGIKLQQLSLLVAGLLAGCAALLASDYLILAGILLAFCTIKPQLAWLPALWLMMWTLRDWRRRQRLFWSFGVTTLLLVGGAELILPGWIGQFWTAIQNYHQYTHNTSVLGWLLTPAVGNLAAIVLVGFVAWICWPSLSASPDSVQFGLALTMVVCLTVLIVPMFAPYNQVLLLPAVMVAAREARVLWNGGRLTRLLCMIMVLVLFWPWAASTTLMGLSFILPPATVQSAWKLPFFTTFTLPLVVFALLLQAFKVQRKISAQA